MYLKNVPVGQVNVNLVPSTHLWKISQNRLSRKKPSNTSGHVKSCSSVGLSALSDDDKEKEIFRLADLDMGQSYESRFMISFIFKMLLLLILLLV